MKITVSERDYIEAWRSVRHSLGLPFDREDPKGGVQ